MVSRFSSSLLKFELINSTAVSLPYPNQGLTFHIKDNYDYNHKFHSEIISEFYSARYQNQIRINSEIQTVPTNHIDKGQDPMSVSSHGNKDNS